MMLIEKNGLYATWEKDDMIMLFSVDSLDYDGFGHSGIVLDSDCVIDEHVYDALDRLREFSKKHSDACFAYSYDKEKTVMVIGTTDFESLEFFHGRFKTPAAALSAGNQERREHLQKLKSQAKAKP